MQEGCVIKGACKVFHPVRRRDVRTASLLALMGLDGKSQLPSTMRLRRIQAHLETRSGRSFTHPELVGTAIFMSIGYRLHGYVEYVNLYPLLCGE